jgi:hypothetical protein
LAMVLMVFHSCCCRSGVKGKDSMRVMWYLYAAILCSAG